MKKYTKAKEKLNCRSERRAADGNSHPTEEERSRPNVPKLNKIFRARNFLFRFQLASCVLFIAGVDFNVPHAVSDGEWNVQQIADWPLYLNTVEHFLLLRADALTCRDINFP